MEEAEEGVVAVAGEQEDDSFDKNMGGSSIKIRDCAESEQLATEEY